MTMTLALPNLVNIQLTISVFKLKITTAASLIYFTKNYLTLRTINLTTTVRTITLYLISTTSTVYFTTAMPTTTKILFQGIAGGQLARQQVRGRDNRRTSHGCHQDLEEVGSQPEHHRGAPPGVNLINIFSNFSLALYFFVKIISAQKLLVKCW